MIQIRIQFFIFVLLAFVITLPTSGLTQYLIRTNKSNLQSINASSLLWQHSVGEVQFAVVPALQNLEQTKIDYEVLDDDVETGIFFWVETRFEGPLRVNEINQSSRCRILWHDQNLALIRTPSHEFLKNVPRNYVCNLINFRKFPQTTRTHFPYQTSLEPNKFSSTIQIILDSVNIDQIYLTERHLTGEELFWNNGETDSIMTRYSYSPEIFKAENYIVSRLENIGLPVELHPFTATTFYDIQFAPEQFNAGWMVSNNKIYGTTNQGQFWSVQYEGSQGAGLRAVFPVNAQTVYAIGGRGLVLKTSNGSQWRSQVSQTNSSLFGLFFDNENLGWICGDQGVILKTSDGGYSWITIKTSTSSRLYDIFFIDDNTGWAVGVNGTILHTTNAGESWKTQTSGSTSRLYGVHFLNSTTGFAIGWQGTVLKTNNGGTDWSPVSIPIKEYFYDIDFIDQTSGMIVGWNGACLKTIDGGNTWESSGNIFGQNIYGLDMVSSSLVCASGTGVIVRNVDMDNNWQKAQYLAEEYWHNIIARKEGTTYPDQHYIICAHYDATSQVPMVRAPGADDNGSGTAAVIEAARVLANYDFQYSIKFILFPAEEQGLIGSREFANAALSRGEQILGVINLDMIGYDSDNDGSMEIHAGNMGPSQTIANLVNSNIINWGLSLIPELKTFNSSTASDHSSFWNAGFPAILIIEDFSDFTPHYHSTNDNLSTLRPGYFLANARLAIGSLALLAEIDALTTSIATDGQIPKEFILYNPYPNPFNPVVQIEYYLPSSEKVVVDIYNLLGQSIKELVNQREGIGIHRITWDGTTNRGDFAASGIYFVRLQFSNQTKTQKLVLIR